MDASLSSLAWSFGALAAIVAAILATGHLLRRIGAGGRGRAGRRLQLVEAMAIDPRRRLLIVRCDGRDLLLLTGGATDRVVGWLPTGDHSPQPAADLGDIA